MEKTETEQRMIDILKEAEDIVDGSYLTTNDARRILNAGYKLLMYAEETKKLRNNWRKKYKDLKSSNHGDKNYKDNNNSVIDDESTINSSDKTGNKS